MLSGPLSFGRDVRGVLHGRTGASGSHFVDTQKAGLGGVRPFVTKLARRRPSWLPSGTETRRRLSTGCRRDQGSMQPPGQLVLIEQPYVQSMYCVSPHSRMSYV